MESGNNTTLKNANATTKLNRFIGKLEGFILPLLNYANLLNNVILAGLTLIVAADVFFRHFLKSPIRGTYEIVQHALLTLIFLGIAHVQVKKRHLSINIISKNFSKGVQALVD